MSDIESLLRQALAPIEPPAELEARVEQHLSDVWDAAQEELADWELSSVTDPRNWVRPVAAAAAGGAAAVGLVLVRTQRKRHRRRVDSDNILELAEHTVRDLAREASRLIDEAQGRR